MREVHHGDGLAFLREHALGSEHAVVTSLPDVSELDLDLSAWRSWFIDTAELVCRSTHDEAVVIFYQTDIKRDGRWVDKGHLLHVAADASGLHCLFHKIVCRTVPGRTTFGRPAYGHWMAFAKRLRFEPGKSTADVLPELGEMTWSRAMPMSAAKASCAFIQKHTPCDIVVDPFCGRGTILAVANAAGLGAIGVEISKKRAKKARALRVARD